ncbi:MAG: response regulator [Acidobacteria bacterium]|nr:response regulator [Acidobacteriota bacterium]
MQEKLKPPRILLVEDHQALATMRRAVLMQHGYEVVCAADGKEACRLLYQESFDLVVTDSELPRASGWEVASAAKKQNLPVILSSGWPIRLTRRQIATRGVDYIAPKPCTLERLLTLIETALVKNN